MPQATLDHLVVAAERLEDGVRHVADTLGVEPVPGGRHDRIHTHNALLRLGESTYLEIIAIDPEAGPPEMPRWFDLDGEDTRALLAQGPRLLTWVARCDDLKGVTRAAAWPTGPIRRMHRGGMTWQIAFPEDGRLNAGGLLPLLIEWDPGGTHPASRLPQAGCRLAGFRGFHPRPGQIRDALSGVWLASALAVHEGAGAVRLEAVIETPAGARTLT